MNTDIEINGNMELSKHSPLEQFDDVMEENVEEKAVSKSQQRFFGMVDAYKKGEMPNASPAIKKAAKGMTKKEVKDFAKTKHKGLPERISEAVDREIEGKIRETVRNMLKSGELPRYYGKNREPIEMAEHTSKILDKALKEKSPNVCDEDFTTCSAIVDDEFRKQGGKQDIDGVKNHEDSVKKGLSKIIKEATNSKYVLYADTMKSGNSDFMADMEEQILKKNVKKALDYVPEEAIVGGEKEIPSSKVFSGEVVLEKDGYVFIRNNNSPHDFLIYKKMKNTIKESTLRKIIREALLVDALSKANIKEGINEISNDTADWAYKEAMRRSGILDFGSPQRVKNDILMKSLKKHRNDKLGFDPDAVGKQIRQSGTSGNEKIDRKWATWEQNRLDRKNGKRTYDEKTGRWTTHLTEADLRSIIRETVQTHLVDVLGKYTQGKTSSKEANKAIMDLANLSNKKKPVNESYAQEGNYTHFAVNKQTNKIVNGWDYSEHENSQLKQYAKDYFIRDLVDYGLDPKQYTILTRVGCKKRGINPDDDNQWENI